MYETHQPTHATALSLRVLRTAGVALAAATAAALGDGPAAAQVSRSAESNPLAEVETALTAGPFVLPFEVEADGAVEAELSGRLAIGGDGRARLEAAGTFAGEAVDLLLVSDGELVTLRWGEEERSVSTPAEIEDALVVGLTRMGVLHNVARLTAGAPPDHADGGVREWVVVHRSETEDTGEPPGIAVDLVVAGQPSGSAVLVLNPDGSPAVRRQTVAFPQGEMRVTERYRELVRGPPPLGTFTIGR